MYRVYDMPLCSGHGFFFFDIVIRCFAREYITMVRCVAYIHVLSMILSFDLNIKIIFHHKFEFDICMTLTFELYLGGVGIFS